MMEGGAGLPDAPNKHLLRAFRRVPRVFGCSLNDGKKGCMGMLAAVEAGQRRDHDAEWKQWESWINDISGRVTKKRGHHHAS